MAPVLAVKKSNIMKRSPYMQNLMTSTYPMVAVEAISGGFDGAWERLIAARVRLDYLADHSEAVEIVNYCISMQPKGTVATKTYMYAAKLITSSTIQTNEKHESIS